MSQKPIKTHEPQSALMPNERDEIEVSIEPIALEFPSDQPAEKYLEIKGRSWVTLQFNFTGRNELKVQEEGAKEEEQLARFHSYALSPEASGLISKKLVVSAEQLKTPLELIFSFYEHKRALRKEIRINVAPSQYQSEFYPRVIHGSAIHLITPATEQTKVFISHSVNDKLLVRRLENELRQAEIQTWVDHSDIRYGESFVSRINEALDWCSTLVLLWSSDAKQSRWVQQELEAALALNKTIMPCILDDTRLPGLLLTKRYVDFHDHDSGIKELLFALRIDSNRK